MTFAPLRARGHAGDRVIPNGKPLAKELLDALVAEIGQRARPPGGGRDPGQTERGDVISAEQANVMAVRAHMVISGLGD